MKNSLCLSVLAVTCLGLGAASAQPPAMLPPPAPVPSAALPSVPFPGVAAPASSAPPGPGTPLSQAALSDNLAYPRPVGSTGVGGDGPIGGEIYLRTGVSINLGGTGIFGRIYEPGVEVQGGIRSVFFRPDPSTAWTVDVGLSTTWYHNRRDETAILRNFASTTGGNTGATSTTTNSASTGNNTTNTTGNTGNSVGVPSTTTSNVTGSSATTTIIPMFPVTPSNLNQSALRLAIGQEYYFLGDADPADGGLKWRAGWDAGGTLGTQKLDTDEIRHLNGTTGGVLAAIHSDVEMPYGQCIFQAGVRAEYRYTWSNILQSQNDTNLSTLNILLSAGVRF